MATLVIKDFKTKFPTIESKEQFISDYDLFTEADSDYEAGWNYWGAEKDGVWIDLYTGEISACDGANLVFLYDLIQAGLVEKIGE